MLVDWIVPEWPCPPWVKACSTTRLGGFSRAPFDSFNLAQHVGDESGAVAQNRFYLRNILELPVEPLWLEQVHSDIVVDAATAVAGETADASYSFSTAAVCVVMTADCLPVLLTDRKGTCVAAIHAGWRGLEKGIITNTIAKLTRPGMELLAWLGPAIGPSAFEVGEDVYHAFIAKNPDSATAFQPRGDKKWMLNIYQLARQELIRQGVNEIYGGGLCTYSDFNRFYSYRRDGRTGRMATLIWLDNRDR